MKKIDARKITILKIIVEEYMEFGGITGSKSLLKKYDIWVSSATIRNDMALLEKMGLIYQPYNSAGRLPTSLGMRVFVDYLIDHLPDNLLWEAESGRASFAWEKNVSKELGVFVMTHRWDHLLWQYGYSDFLQKNFHLGSEKLAKIFEMFEDGVHLLWAIWSLESKKKLAVFFPAEHQIESLEDFVIIKKELSTGESVTLIWSMILDYPLAFALLRNPDLTPSLYA